MSRRDLAIEQIVSVRDYTRRLLDNVRPEDWFLMPPGGVSHVAWQVGHLSFAQFRLALLRTRGARPGDEQILPARFLELFGAKSRPDPDTGRYPDANEIREVFDRVHQQVLVELSDLPESELDAPPATVPHPIAKTKLWALLWCAQHEMVHAGQIGLIRRQLGYDPLW
jgi:hypothetical protein